MAYKSSKRRWSYLLPCTLPARPLHAGLVLDAVLVLESSLVLDALLSTQEPAAGSAPGFRAPLCRATDWFCFSHEDNMMVFQ